jgi:hypothetical protein
VNALGAHTHTHTHTVIVMCTHEGQRVMVLSKDTHDRAESCVRCLNLLRAELHVFRVVSAHEGAGRVSPRACTCFVLCLIRDVPGPCVAHPNYATEHESASDTSAPHFSLNPHTATNRIGLYGHTGFFSIPLHKAAVKLGISRTAMKAACRKLGICKW